MPVSSLVLLSLFIFLIIAESFIPLRKFVLSRWIRISRNLSMAFIGFLIIKLIFLPHLISFSKLAQANNLGILNLFEMGFWPKTILSVIFMDFTLYFWHLANHKVPFFWRFHLVHHTDLEMDVSTAARFHFGELVLSVFFRALQILIFGVDPLSLLIFETAVTFFALFHHSNLKLPLNFERILNKVFVTPRMHAIHHSQYLEETDSNFSAIFSYWDRPFKTLLLNVPQKEITIGVPSYGDIKDLNFINLIIMPFQKVKIWTLKKRNEDLKPKDYLCG